MSLMDSIRTWFSMTSGLDAPQVRTEAESGSLDDFVARLGYANRAYRLPSVREALAVPAIQRAVSLIANTTGSLAVEGFRSGALMPDAPRVITRPDPFNTPRDFYRDTAFSLASRGEGVLWIASRDADNLAAALIVVPLHELNIEENTRNRLFPIYRWGRVESTRYSPANPSGQFVHITYLKDHPLALHGLGPLQLCGAAVSVSVEAQEWAANFYADGGKGGTTIHMEYEPGTEKDEDDLTEADRIREQWIARGHNGIRVVGPSIEDIKEHEPNEAGAQMLQSREYQNGDAARMFGIPGSLLDYGAPGSSLTYQNVAEEYAKFVRTCLAPNYLEPIEQALTDLLPRQTVARFNVKGLLRADVKTRFDVYEKAVKLGIYDVDYAKREEGIAPGSIEVAPVPFAPPAAVPASIPQKTRAAMPEVAEIRCDGMASKRRGGISRIEKCNRLLSRTGAFAGQCPRCKKDYAAKAAA